MNGGHKGPCALNKQTKQCKKSDIGDTQCEVSNKGACKKKLVAKTIVVVMVNVMIQNVFVPLDGRDLNVKNTPHAPTHVAVMAFAF